MSDSMEQPGVSLVLTDHDQTYYVIPLEVFERGRVPAERRAEVEEALREHEVTGHNLLLVAGGMAVVGSGMFISGVLMGGGAVFAGMALRNAYDNYTTETNNSSTPIGSGDTPTVVREG